MTMNSIGDLARSLVLQRGVNATKIAHTTLLTELSTGVKSDIAKAVSGNLSPLAGIDNRLSRLSVWADNVKQLSTDLGAAQSALGAISAIGQEQSNALLLASSNETQQPVDLAAIEGKANLAATISILNAQSGGKSLFAGTATDKMAVASSEVILANVMPLIAGATSADEVMSIIGDWFNSPTGYEAVAYQGSDAQPTTLVEESSRMGLNVTANSKEIKGLLTGLVAAAALASGTLSSSPTEQRTLARMTAEHLVNNAYEQTEMASRVGISQQHLDRLQAKQSAESSALQIARTSLTEADAYDVATALEQAETRLALLHTLTSRLQNLSLVGYLR